MNVLTSVKIRYIKKKKSLALIRFSSVDLEAVFAVKNTS
jgi:predicted DNA binding CopG/RHH family protein